MVVADFDFEMFSFLEIVGCDGSFIADLFYAFGFGSGTFF